MNIAALTPHNCGRQASWGAICSSSTFSDTKLALLTNPARRRRPSHLLECLAWRAGILERWQVGFAIGASIGSVGLQVVGDFWCTTAFDQLPLQITRDRRQSLYLLLQGGHEVLHAFAAQAHDLLLDGGLGGFRVVAGLSLWLMMIMTVFLIAVCCRFRRGMTLYNWFLFLIVSRFRRSHHW